MRQGADRSSLAERRDDLNETPACATEALLRVEPLPRTIWEPAAGRGAISRVLEAAGHFVHKADLVHYPSGDCCIVPGQDFLMETQPQARTIVTNPPYKLADEFIEHGLDLGCTVIVLLRMMFVEGVDGAHRGSGLRSRLIDRHLVRVWLGRERLPMMHREGWAGKKQEAATLPFAWFVFSPHEHAPGLGFQTIRMSWRGK